MAEHRQQAPNEDVPVTPLTYHVLLALAERPLHGYGIIKDIAARTDGRLRVATGTMYLALRRLRSEGWIEEVEVAGGDERRKSYGITARGREIAAAEARRMAELVEAAVERHLVDANPRGRGE